VIANPPPWPHGARCAAAITFDVDVDSMLHLVHPTSAHRRVAAQSWTRYDQVAIPRILAAYAEYQIRQTFFFPAWCIERYPELARTVLEAGHEVGLHGYQHELAYEQPRDVEARLLDRSVALAESVLGIRSRGWRAPYYGFSPASAELLVEQGFLYHSGLMGDDVPYILRTPKGDLWELPTDWAMDDWPQYVQSPDFDYLMPIRAPQRATEVFMAQFEEAWAAGGLWIATWHPFVSGRLAPMRAVRQMIEHMLSKGGVWLTTLENIAQHVHDCTTSGTYAARIDRFPYYDGPVNAQLSSARMAQEETTHGR
jgi:peptidoglycan-N-acetylglucosamine deacetylase